MRIPRIPSGMAEPSAGPGKIDWRDVGILHALLGRRECREGTCAPKNVDRLAIEYIVARRLRYGAADHIACAVQHKSHDDRA